MVQEQETPQLDYRLKKCEPESLVFTEHSSEKRPRSPTEWFNKKFPQKATLYGPAFLEGTYFDLDQATHIVPVALNEDFFAGILGGSEELNHRLVFYLPEQCFYFFDSRFGYYAPTTEEKLKTLLSQYLIRCAVDLGNGVDLRSLFVEMRKDEQLRCIVKRAKSMLAADESFFSGIKGHKRKLGSEVFDPTADPPHRLFVLEGIVAEPEQILTMNDAYKNFERYCAARGLTVIPRKHFKHLIAEVVREEFGLGIRKDLRTQDGGWTHGWKGVTCRLPGSTSNTQN